MDDDVLAALLQLDEEFPAALAVPKSHRKARPTQGAQGDAARAGLTTNPRSALLGVTNTPISTAWLKQERLSIAEHFGFHCDERNRVWVLPGRNGTLLASVRDDDVNMKHIMGVWHLSSFFRHTLRDLKLKCAICDAPAGCIGRYDDSDGWSPACDGCCAHGCEDGQCIVFMGINTV